MNVSNLELILVQKISNSTSTLDTLIYSKALQELKTGTITVVNTTAELPNPNTALTGHLFYEKTTEAMYIVDKLGYARKIPVEKNLYTWGVGSLGRLGAGTTIDRSSPGTTAGGGTNWCAVAAGYSGTAVKTDGTLWTWGRNTFGQLGDGTTTNRSSPGTVAGGGTNWCAVGSGSGMFSFSAAIKTDGTLWTWGYNSSGALGDGTTTQRSSPGTVAGGGTNWCAVSIGYSYMTALKTDGTLWTWGVNNSGELGTGTAGYGTCRSSPGTTASGGTNWCAVSAASGHAVAVKTDGTLWTWGANSNGQLGTGNTTARSTPGTTVAGGTDWRIVSTRAGGTAAIKTNGTLWTWGFNLNGELGNGTTISRSSPGEIFGGGTNWCAVRFGNKHAAAIKTDGTLWTWGSNGYGQLGDGTKNPRSSPGTVIGGKSNWCTASAGQDSTIAIGDI